VTARRAFLSAIGVVKIERHNLALRNRLYAGLTVDRLVAAPIQELA
jgi:hypothetical protein